MQDWHIKSTGRRRCSTLERRLLQVFNPLPVINLSNTYSSCSHVVRCSGTFAFVKTPKFHLLEHIVIFAEKWHFLGAIAESGGEHLHQEFKREEKKRCRSGARVIENVNLANSKQVNAAYPHKKSRK